MPNTYSGADTYLAKRISETPRSKYPFDHCVVDNAFPADLFEAIHTNWPSDEVMKPLSEAGRTYGDAYEERKIMLIEPEYMEKLSQSHQIFWQAVEKVVTGSIVCLACCQKFQDIVVPRVEHLKGSLRLSPELLVVSDRSNYAIGPHTDRRARLASMLFYLSPGDEYRSYGTGLYELKNPKVKTFENEHYGFEHFTCRTRIDYIPNRMVAFPRSDRSFHGVEPVPVENCDRRLLIVNIRAPAGAL